MRFYKNFSILVMTMSLTMISCKEANSEPIAIVQQEDPVTALPYFNTPDFTPQWDRPTHQIPAFSFTNQNGETVTNESYSGKIYVADFFFTICPGICPKLASSMSTLQATFKDDGDVLLLSHSVMPWHDTVEVLKEYAEINGVNDNKWNLVTGDKEALYNIARNGYFADEDFTKTQDPEKFIHTENFILVDENGHIRGVYNGTLDIDIKRLIRHIEILKKEHS